MRSGKFKALKEWQYHALEVLSILPCYCWTGRIENVWLGTAIRTLLVAWSSGMQLLKLAEAIDCSACKSKDELW